MNTKLEYISPNELYTGYKLYGVEHCKRPATPVPWMQLSHQAPRLRIYNIVPYSSSIFVYNEILCFKVNMFLALVTVWKLHSLNNRCGKLWRVYLHVKNNSLEHLSLDLLNIWFSSNIFIFRIKRGSCSAIFEQFRPITNFLQIRKFFPFPQSSI